jgi:hypothetical protein
VTSDVLDEAYDRLHHWGPEFGGENGLSNHAPMAVEVLTRHGHEDQVGSWLDRYVARLETLPAEDDPITEGNWAAAMGKRARVGDWVAFFRRAVREAPWQTVMADWWPRLLPAIASGATHGLIRTGHAVRTVLAGDTSPSAVDEVAHALAYWAARAIFVPGLAAPAEPRPAASGSAASGSAADPAELMARAAEHGDEHVIKLTDTVLDVYHRTGGDPAVLAAATHCATLIQPPPVTPRRPGNPEPPRTTPTR